MLLSMRISIFTLICVVQSKQMNFKYDHKAPLLNENHKALLSDDEYTIEDESLLPVDYFKYTKSHENTLKREQKSVRVINTNKVHEEKSVCNLGADECMGLLIKESINDTNIFTIYERLEFLITKKNVTSGEEHARVLKNVTTVLQKLNEFYETPQGTSLRNVNAEAHVDSFCKIIDAYMNVSKLISLNSTSPNQASASQISKNIEEHFQSIRNLNFTYKAEYANLDIITFNPLFINITGTKLDSHGIDSIAKKLTIAELDSIVYVNTNKLYTGNDKFPRLSIVVYKNNEFFQETSNRFVLTNIISITTGKNVTAKELVTVHFPQFNFSEIQKSSHDAIFSCVWWDYLSSRWSRDGCYMNRTSSGEPFCVCNHTTNFAIILDTNDTEFKCEICSLLLEILSYSGSSLSIVGLIITLIVIIANHKPKKRGSHFSNKLMFRHYMNILAGFCICLLMLNINFIIFSFLEFNQSPVACILFGVLMHYTLLATFLWMLSLAILQYFIYIRVFIVIDYFSKMATALSMILPVIPIVIVLSIDWMLYVNHSNYCWPHGITQLVTIVLPIGILLTINLLIFVIIIREHYVSNSLSTRTSSSSTTNSQNSSYIITPNSFYSNQMVQHTKRLKRRLLAISSTLTVNTGITWIFGLFLIVPSQSETTRVIFSFLFCMFNSFQGIFIYLTYVLVAKLKNFKK